MKIFLEAAGCLTANYLITAIREAGHESVASDANPQSIGRLLADYFYTVPMAYEKSYVETVLNILVDNGITLVIPTLDDALLKWDSMRDILNQKGISLALSCREALNICLDKWYTYKIFVQNSIPTPKTSLKQEYSLVKPRNGRGGSDVSILQEDVAVDMTGMISQELLLGKEYTVDVFCNINNDPVYIVPRLRQSVKDGKSTGGEVVYHQEIIDGIKKICSVIPLMGAVNIQCFDTADGVKFTEINPRYGGGTVLGMKATENWIPLVVDTFVDKKTVVMNHEPEYGLKMGRYYAEIFYK